MSSVVKDIRFSCRTLLRAPGFTLAAVLVVALGVGANTAVFSMLNAYLLAPLGLPASDRLVWVSQVHREQNISGSVSYPLYLDWREQNQVFEDMTAFTGASLNLTGEGEPERVLGWRVTGSYLPTAAVKPVLGRNFLPEEDRPGGPKVVILSNGIWKRRFAGSRNILGRTVDLNGEPHTIVGVLPPGASLQQNDEVLLLPLALARDSLPRGNQFLGVVARLKPGVTAERALADLKTICKRLPDDKDGWTAGVSNFRDRIYRGAREGLTTIMVVVALVLLIACVNVANLLLAKGASRRKEIGIRAALGAGRWRIARQMIIESLLLSGAGAAAGLLLGSWGSSLLFALVPIEFRPFTPVGTDGTVLAFTTAVALATGLLFGAAPAFISSRADVNDALKEGSRGSTGRHGRLRNTLVVVEVALAMILLVGAGLVLKSFARLLNVNPGFRSDGLLTAGISLSEKRYADDAARAAFYERTMERIAALPEVESAGAINVLPLNRSNTNSTFYIEGRPVPQKLDEWPIVGYRVITPDYLRAMRIGLVKGRHFTAADRQGTAGVAIVNEAAARRYWPNENPIGKHIRYGPPEAPWLTIVGVVSNVRHFGLDADFWPEVYVAQAQAPRLEAILVVRTHGDPLNIVSVVRGAIREVDPFLPLSRVRTMQDVVAASTFIPRLMTIMLASFAALAAVLAAVGLYGVVSYGVAQRSHEIGIRMALGAARGHVLRMVVGHGMFLTFVGLAIGLAGALAATAGLRAFLFNVQPRDPATFTAVGLLLIAVGLLATWIPARRALRVDPIHSLRYE